MGIGAGTAAVIGLAGTALSAGVGVIGAITTANAQSDAAKFQAQVASNNAIIADRQAQTTIAAGEQQATISGLKTRATVGAIKAAQGASNVDVNTGSAVDVRSSQAELGMEDQLTIRSNAARQAYGYQVQSVSDTAQAQLDQQKASSAQTAGFLSAGGSLIGGASSVGKQFSDFKTSGALGSSPPPAASTPDASLPFF